LGFDFDYYVIGPLMIFGPWLLGGIARWYLGRTWLGAGGAVVLGLALTGTAYAVLLFTTPASAEEACGEDECVRVNGQWLEVTVARGWPIDTAAAWTISAAVLSFRRRSNEHVVAH
jgi:hypothetical protein